MQSISEEAHIKLVKVTGEHFVFYDWQDPSYSSKNKNVNLPLSLCIKWSKSFAVLVWFCDYNTAEFTTSVEVSVNPSTAFVLPSSSDFSSTM